jgi:hypothetical protein
VIDEQLQAEVARLEHERAARLAERDAEWARLRAERQQAIDRVEQELATLRGRRRRVALTRHWGGLFHPGAFTGTVLVLGVIVGGMRSGLPPQLAVVVSVVALVAWWLAS